MGQNDDGSHCLTNNLKLQRLRAHFVANLQSCTTTVIKRRNSHSCTAPPVQLVAKRSELHKSQTKKNPQIELLNFCTHTENASEERMEEPQNGAVSSTPAETEDEPVVGPGPAPRARPKRPLQFEQAYLDSLPSANMYASTFSIFFSRVLGLGFMLHNLNWFWKPWVFYFLQVWEKLYAPRRGHACCCLSSRFFHHRKLWWYITSFIWLFYFALDISLCT